jgi:hypothetical protein
MDSLLGAYGLVVFSGGGLEPWAALLFVTFYGLGNGLNTIVKGTAMAQYVSRDHVGQLNGMLGLPLALGRAAAPLALGLMWTPEVGYTHGLRWLLLLAFWVSRVCGWRKSALTKAHIKALTNWAPTISECLTLSSSDAWPNLALGLRSLCPR